MSKFKKKKSGGQPAISTASLPDIVFMLLFFFMVTTVMREVTLKVEVKTPKATEVNKLERKSLVSYIYIGAPIKSLQSQFGTADRIQLNDAFATEKDIIAFVESEREQTNPVEVPLMTFSMKVDKAAEMGIVTDVKQELRKANALKINYSTGKTDKIVD
ncbi:MAG: biopolymer transporter ExbD [Bacteroidetes bacterium]|nr:MAG: biopolymer transporter ExbD [Bacteroidota bacterium]MBL1143422.1 biopolymer transporter ExbD [Bacteroidota bacterium]MCB0801455.1 biopolymer transporter ExbD [Flavobacteriales bacterium]NOG56226.1 biopolymer transporter ExbD [Bacteroidota bacterium]